MSKQNEEERLPKPFDAMLQGWPVAERDEAAWDDGAEKIAERLATAKAEASANLALLDAPLPAERGEAGFDSSPRAAEPPPRSLAELARMSLATQDAKSDAADIARESLSVASTGRASVPMIAEAEAAAAAAGQSAPRAAPPPVATLQPLPARPAPRSAAGPLAMAAIGLVGLAAAAVIVVRAQRANEPAPLAAAPPSAAPAAVAPKPAASAPGQEIVALKDLAPSGGAAAGPKPSGEKLALKGAEPKPEEPSAAPEAKPQVAPEAVAKAEDKKDDDAAKMKPAATAGELPDKPSTGAVQAAIGAVMGSARACVAGQDEDSRATITFGSDGRVQSVAVSGKAAGTPAEACIRAALSKARVQPFARATFSVGSAIRP